MKLDLRIGTISELWRLGDTDDLSETQKSKIITDLFRISYFYLHRPSRVKPKPDHLAPPKSVMLPVNLTVSKSR